MQISEIGRTPYSKPPVIRHRIDGFTLIELIVVTVIISILIGATVFSVAVSDRANAKEMGKRLTTIMHTLSTESILSGESYGLDWNESGRYIAVVCFNTEEEKWLPLESCPSKQTVTEVFPNKQARLNLPRRWGMVFSTDPESAPLHEFGDVPTKTDEQDELVPEVSDAATGDGQEGVEDKEEITPWVRFEPTGLWQPDGVIQIVIAEQYQIAFRWTATGRVNTMAPKPPEEDI